ncbi:Uncharacterised protein [Candidatus Tiddalikarchaeum anstoanum]|nr:Uncharacterised protein [Candidatus Tiddalikarchaeum anstoanum]
MDLIVYLQIAFVSFIINIVPAFMPPTWLVLSISKVNYPSLNTFAIAAFGVLGSLTGRYVMYYYSKFLGKYIKEGHKKNVYYFRKLVGSNNVAVFLMTLIYSLGPVPSNFLFISFGLSEIKLLPVLLGFSIGRFVSYVLLIDVSFQAFSYLSLFVNVNGARIIADILGIFFAVIIVFVKWEKLYLFIEKLKVKKANKNRI